MGALDPLAALVAGNADLTALIDAELAALAGDAQALRSLLVEDAVVTARVLPSNGLTDLIEIAGRRVAASLPPTVRPGDVLQVRVTGFDGERILLQIVGTGADAAVEPGPPNLPLAPQPGAFVAATIVSPPAGSPYGTPTAPAQAAPTAAAPSSANTAAVASAVQPSIPPPPGSPARAGLAPEFTSAVSRANVAPAQTGELATAARGVSTAAEAVVTALRATIAPAEPTSIEARVATARAAVAQVAPTADAPATAVPARFVAPPQIEPKTLVPNLEAVVRRVPPGAYHTAPAAAATAIPGAPRASGLSAYTEPVALLRALRLAVTPSNVAAAALALDRPDRLPAALAALERALPRASDDPNVATLRTLLAFVGRIDPRSPALASQIAAYVDHVVDGAEPKLATLLAATRAAAPPAAAHDGAPPDPPRPLPAALAAERSAVLSTDLKQTLLAVAANPATPEALAPALAGALTALTAVQMTAAQTLAAQPDGIAFTIPLVTPYGSSNAHISVKREAPQGRGARLDPANFRIAFVLDTAHYGTVAIDLVTVGREVTVDVRTEAAPAMRAFRDALGGLTARLESLRYRVASAGASLGTTSTIAVEAPPVQPLDPTAAVDRSA